MDYSKTINLPSSEFPMKANLSTREPEILKKWQSEDIYKKILESRKDSNVYILHDGPPYANGHIHLGHALNKILKDIIVKHKTMMGFRAPYVPGWDCHGLPIELQVTKELGPKARTMEKNEIRSRCRKYADRFINIQMEEFKRLGVLGNYENPYLTMTKQYEASILETFGRIFQEGYIYKSRKPIYWCPTCVTALAEAEVEYDDHTSPSIYVKFKLDPGSIDIDGVDKNNAYAVIWTTTPWTLPANLAVCFHPDYPYSVYKFGDEFYVLADGLVEQMSGITGLKGEKHSPIKREQIEKLRPKHPFIERESRVLFGNFVTLEQGTGIVHIAPGHGQDDYILGLENSMDILSPVDGNGRFTEEFDLMKGENVFDSNPRILELLKEKKALIYSSEIGHSYPHCWRCKKPLIFRATEQWFLKIDHKDMRSLAVKASDSTQWIPSWGEQRFRGMIDNRPDWCLSRQRSWGVPIPSFICRECHKNLMTTETIMHFAKLSLEKSIDSWYTEDIKDLVPKGTKCQCGCADFDKEYDILDVWFDSGVSHFAVLENWEELSWPADLYLEGSDQHRGWFQSSLWPSLALKGRAPYNIVLTHGFVLDEAGKAMSKSQGNVIPPEDLIKKFGADILRLWVSSEDYRNDVRIGYDMIKQITDSYRKIRNSFKFIIGNISDFSDADRVPYEDLSDMDKWILHKLAILSGQTIDSYEKFEFHLVYRRIMNFCAVELSSIYFDISKDILYIEKAGSKKRRANQTVLKEVYNTLVRLLAPVLAFTSEEIWGYSGNKDSVHVQHYYKLDDKYNNAEIESRMNRLVEIKKDVLKALEIKRKDKIIGTSLEARINLYTESESAGKLLLETEDLNKFFQVAEVEILEKKTDNMEKMENTFISVEKSPGKKCIRCWNYYSEKQIGTDSSHPEICPRCTDIVKQLDQ